MSNQTKTFISDVRENKDPQTCISETDVEHENRADSSQEKSELTPVTLSDTDVTKMANHTKTLISDVRDNKDPRICISKTDGEHENRTDSPQEKSGLIPVMLSDTEKFSSEVITVPSDETFPDSLKTGSTHVSCESNCACPVLSMSHSSASLTYDSSEESDSISAKTGRNSISSAEVFVATETFLESLPQSENSPNISLQSEKICESDIQAYETQENSTEQGANNLTPAERHQWVPMNRKYIQNDGYRLGIIPGAFYSSNKGYFVEVPNGVNYEIILTNENPIPCNVEVFIDNNPKPAICFRLRPDKPMKFGGPTFCKNKFVFFRSRDAPPKSGIDSENTSNGIVEAVFTPQKIEDVRGRSVSEPVPFSRNVNNALQILGIGRNEKKLRSYTSGSANTERSFDLNHFCQGATALRGEQEPKLFKRAELMETDDTRRVVIRLRLITRTDDPSVPNEGDICSLCPPSVTELL